jgi:hypothetical protein
MKLEPSYKHTMQPQVHSHKSDYETLKIIHKIKQIATSFSQIYNCIGVIFQYLQVTFLAQMLPLQCFFSRRHRPWPKCVNTVKDDLIHPLSCGFLCEGEHSPWYPEPLFLVHDHDSVSTKKKRKDPVVYPLTFLGNGSLSEQRIGKELSKAFHF